MENDKTQEDGTTIDINSMAFTGSNTTSCSFWSSLPSTYSIASGGTGVTTYNYTTMAPSTHSSGIRVDGDADFQGDVKINGRSIVDTLDAIERRLSILVPDPKKLAKYNALQKAYEHYKTLEAMSYGDDDE